MLILALALTGAAAGLALDAIIIELAIPPSDEESADEPRSRPRLHAEAGALVLGDEGAARAWLRRVAVAGVTAGLFALAATRYDGAAQLAAVCAYIGVFIVCAGTDLLAYRVPNVVTYPAIVGALVAGAFVAEAEIGRTVAGGAIAGGVLLVPALFTAGAGMGMGDVKLAAFAGLALGFPNVAPALLAMALLGGLAAALLLVFGIRKRGEPIAYAPFISAGALVALLWRGAAFANLA
jgi:prepilin signal peptidase PulO-like enzyme (type II secretory pathway)